MAGKKITIYHDTNGNPYGPHQVAARCGEKRCFDAHGCEVRGHCQNYELLKDMGIYD